MILWNLNDNKTSNQILMFFFRHIFALKNECGIIILLLEGCVFRLDESPKLKQLDFYHSIYK
jgi:hypothetical protein